MVEHRPMILTVTPNPAYDVTYAVPRVTLGDVHRVAEVRERAGGKGINVGRVLDQLGEPVCVLGFGDAAFTAALDRDGIAHDLVEALPHVRRTLVVHAEQATSFWEPGATLSDGAEAELMRRTESRLANAHGLVVSGSLPRGTDPRLPARLAQLAIDAGVPVVVDCDGEPLRRAAKVPGVVLMPNADEARVLAGGSDDWLSACRSLVESGVRAVVATRGEDGMAAILADRCLQAVCGDRLEGNPTGAGDAAAAAMIAGLARGQLDWSTLLTDAVSTSAAAVVAPAAGEVDLATRDRLRAKVRVHPLEKGPPG
ncbi:1-phosphofructokinase family hexose kinase [Solicola gregarius]|uniref:Hexose kinase n=1 Tax=Solicola gregarius TaxID=2908642 RepID=A0AA46TFY6_9ACTN|nr:hexose kinase [Solicola gregarius]UYM04144.1 hexose kinase [Solicola gregarius]